MGSCIVHSISTWGQVLRVVSCVPAHIVDEISAGRVRRGWYHSEMSFDASEANTRTER